MDIRTLEGMIGNFAQNPFTAMGLGLLNQPTMGRGMAAGLGLLQQMQAFNLQRQIQQAQLSQFQSAQEREQHLQQLREQIAGSMGQASPQALWRQMLMLQMMQGGQLTPEMVAPSTLEQMGPQGPYVQQHPITGAGRPFWPPGSMFGLPQLPPEEAAPAPEPSGPGFLERLRQPMPEAMDEAAGAVEERQKLRQRQNIQESQIQEANDKFRHLFGPPAAKLPGVFGFPPMAMDAKGWVEKNVPNAAAASELQDELAELWPYLEDANRRWAAKLLAELKKRVNRSGTIQR